MTKHTVRVAMPIATMDWSSGNLADGLSRAFAIASSLDLDTPQAEALTQLRGFAVSTNFEDCDGGSIYLDLCDIVHDAGYVNECFEGMWIIYEQGSAWYDDGDSCRLDSGMIHALKGSDCVPIAGVKS